jgi:hypothetical protein
MGPVEPTTVFTSARIDPEAVAGSPEGCFAGDGPKRFTQGAPAVLAIRISGGVSGINTSPPKRDNSVIVIYWLVDMKPGYEARINSPENKPLIAKEKRGSFWLPHLFFLLAIPPAFRRR